MSASSGIEVQIFDLNGNKYFDTTNDVSNNSQTYVSVKLLCAGIYMVQVTYKDNAMSSSSGFPIPVGSFFNLNYTINTSSNSYASVNQQVNCIYLLPIPATDSMLNQRFALVPGQQMEFSAWVREDCGTPCFITNYTNPVVELKFPGSSDTSITLSPSGTIIEGWQRVDAMFTVPANATTASLALGSDSALNVYFDDIRMHPFNADMKSYVYDPQTLRLMAELDENNYTTFYDYDEEGQLVRVKKETIQGIKTIKETRTAKQKSITNVQ
jgi:hypothetical protein